MNINLPSEDIWSLVVTSLIGLWLIWQAVKINSEIDILQLLVNWFRDRPIILPSLLFLISPFLSTYIFHNLPPNFNQIVDNKILVQVLTTFGAVISFWIGNRALESFRKTQEQKKIAKIFIASMESHLEYLNKIKQNLSITLNKYNINNIESIINRIKADYIYESALKLVGIFDSQTIDFIYRYSRNISSDMDEILNSYEKINGFIGTTKFTILSEKIKALSMEAKLCLIKLSKEIVQDDDKFNAYTKSIIDEYGKNRAKGVMESFATLEMQEILRLTEKLFEGYGFLPELNASYNEEKIPLEIEQNTFLENVGFRSSTQPTIPSF
ncbi:hypothetical protein VB713_05460 [Anabaena cylindrica UHCC 0172]|uniref:hypothetical protein n=1 Tax=Anabaena cylindrica TaxID=1165 RepID=UPI002B1F8590|nr:hypothetical protein [Anabaena cylindrica]MEA5550431.1 hypothetical protein [Anabaena cylindrica UHCC 0172]